MAPIFPIGILFLSSAVFCGVLTSPLEPLPGKSGEDQVKEVVHKAELAARDAALESEKNGNGAELRVAAIKAKLAAQRAIKQHMQRQNNLHSKLKSLRKWGHANRLTNNLKSYNNQKNYFSPILHHHFRRPRHRNSFSKMISLNDLASDAAVQNKYQEDTTLEDRLALEAEEDKKYGNADNDLYSSARSSLSSQDATQSIQNQVASESARELKEIQQQINAESQNSLGKTSMGSPTSGALFQGNPSTQTQGQQKPQARNGMLNVQSDLRNAFDNAEGMNTDSNIMNPQASNGENYVGGNAFTGLGEEQQPHEISHMNSDMPGMPQMPNPGFSQNEQIGEGQASMESPQGESAQSAAMALAAGAGQAAFSNSQPLSQNDGGGFGGAAESSNPAESMGPAQPGNMKALGGGILQGGNSLGEEEILSGANMGSNNFPGPSMKKSKINDFKRVSNKQ